MMTPLFPLQLVAYPGEILNIHVFEPRYKDLINDCMANGLQFGLSPFIDNEIRKIGTLMEVRAIEKEYEDGRMDVRTQAQRLFILDEYFNPMPGKKYPGGEVRKMETDEEGDPKLARRIGELIREIFDALHLDKELPAHEKIRSFDIAHFVGFSLEQEYELLSIPSEYDRQIVILDQLTKIAPNVKTNAKIKEKALLNGEFRNIQPPDIDNT